MVQNLNLDFAEVIAKRGHQRQIVNSESEKTSVPKGVTPITREGFLDHIQHLMNRTRGRELPGTFNPMVVTDLFLEQSTPWEAITQSHVKKVWEAAKDFISLITAYAADPATSKALFQKVFEPALSQLMESLKAKTTELLKPHKTSHPITYNHYFTEALQKVHIRKRDEDEYMRIVRNFLGLSSYDSLESVASYYRDFRPLVAALVDRPKPDVYRFACSEALDYMEAYYKVVYSPLCPLAKPGLTSWCSQVGCFKTFRRRYCCGSYRSQAHLPA